MGMTIAEKILAKAARLDRVTADTYITAKADRMMTHEAFALSALTLKGMGIDTFHDPDRVVVILDHYFPAPTIQMADVHVLIRQMVQEYGVNKFYRHTGICHQVMCERGEVIPGQLILGTDSHTTTYGALGAAGTGIGQTEMSYVLATGELWMKVPQTIRFDITGGPTPGIMGKDLILYIAGQYGTEVAQYMAVEFTGPVAERLSLADRLTISNMGVEIGAKFAFFEADDKAVSYVRERTRESVSPIGPDPDASYSEVYSIDITCMEPQVACPHNPGNVKSVSEISNTVVQQAFLGSCTNGRLEDIAIATKILKGRQVHPETRLIVSPASQEVLIAAGQAGYIQDLMEAGAVIAPAGCGACPGGHMGVIGRGESCISSTNRNFIGRMGSEEASVYLGSPATVAASAITGHITDPREFWNESII